MEKFGPIVPLMEAMAYFKRRAERNKVKENLNSTIKQYPDKADEISKNLTPIIALEELLDKKLKVEEEKIAYFFEPFPGIDKKRLMGYNAATLLLFSILVDHPETIEETEQLFEVIKNKTYSEHMDDIYFNFDSTREIKKISTANPDDFFNYVNWLPIPLECKWKTMDVLHNFDKRLNELIIILRPAMKLIYENHERLCDNLLKDFRSRYSNPLAYINSFRNVPIEENVDFVLRPLLFDFDSRISFKHTNTSFSAMLGLLYGEFKELEESANSISNLATTMRTLADVTRMEIIFFLKDKVAYNQEIAERFNMLPAAVSHHMGRLISDDFANVTVKSGKSYYSLNMDVLDSFLTKFHNAVMSK